MLQQLRKIDHVEHFVGRYKWNERVFMNEIYGGNKPISICRWCLENLKLETLFLFLILIVKTKIYNRKLLKILNNSFTNEVATSRYKLYPKTLMLFTSIKYHYHISIYTSNNLPNRRKHYGKS